MSTSRRETAPKQGRRPPPPPTPPRDTRQPTLRRPRSPSRAEGRTQAAPAPPSPRDPPTRVLAAFTWLPHGLVDVLVSGLWGQKRSVEAPGTHGAASAPPPSRPLAPVPNTGREGWPAEGGSCHASAGGVARQVSERRRQGATHGPRPRSTGHDGNRAVAVTTRLNS